MSKLLCIVGCLLVGTAVMVAAANLDPCEGVTVAQWQAVPQPWSTSLDSPNPLGYRTAQFYEDNSPPYCMQVNNVANKKVEIMIQSQQADARICVKDNSNPVSTNSPGSITACGVGKVHACFPAETGTNTMNLVFFCDTGCISGTVSFYHRIRISSVTWSDNQDDALTNLEMWCMMQDTLNDTIFPSDLMQDEPDVYPVTVADSASATQPLFFAIPLLAGLLVALFR